MKRTRAALFTLLFVSFAYFYQAGGWNQNSRFALVRAITNEHTLNIDPFSNATGSGGAWEDRATFAGAPAATPGLASYADSATTQYNVKGYGKSAALALTLTSGQ